MTDTTPTTDDTWTSTTTTYDVDADVISEAVANGVAAAEPTTLGQYGQVYVVPDGFKAQVLDIRTYSDEVLPLSRDGVFPFVGVPSVAAYVNRYKTDSTLGYITDVYGVGTKALVADLGVATFVLDDMPVDGTAHRRHKARLVLRPTTAARRWGAVLDGKQLTQEAMLDLVVDGIGEIAQPDGASLRDLISDLHAIRTTEARSVIRTGGQAKIEVADNVQLHAGSGNAVTVPERMTVVFQPFAGIHGLLSLDVTIKPQISPQNKVVFTLSAPSLDDGLARIVGDVAADLTDATDITMLWTPS